jgi:hypothetical protein
LWTPWGVDTRALSYRRIASRQVRLLGIGTKKASRPSSTPISPAPDAIRTQTRLVTLKETHKPCPQLGIDPQKLAFLNPEAPTALAQPARRRGAGTGAAPPLERGCGQPCRARLRRRAAVRPVNIRYALDTPNMQLWTLRNAVRYALVLADGPAILVELAGCEHLAAGRDDIDQIRPAIGWLFMAAGSGAAAGPRRGLGG